MKKIFLLLCAVFTLVAKDVTPNKIIKISGVTVDIVRSGDKLYVATDSSSVDIIDIKSKKVLKHIKIAKIKDFMGDTIDSKIYSVDVINGMVLILSQDNGGFRRVDIYKNGKLKHIITKDDKLVLEVGEFVLQKGKKNFVKIIVK